MEVIIYIFNLNVSPKVSHGVIVILLLQIHAYDYDFVIKDFVIKKGLLFVLDPVYYIRMVGFQGLICFFNIIF